MDGLADLGLLRVLWLANVKTGLADASWLSAMEKLKFMWVEQTDVSTLPEDFGKLTELQLLFFNKNGLRRLPTSIGRMTSLVQARLDFNEITAIPDEVQEMRSLQTLDLFCNNLTRLPAGLTASQLPDLEKLDVSCQAPGFAPESLPDRAQCVTHGTTNRCSAECDGWKR